MQEKVPSSFFANRASNFVLDICLLMKQLLHVLNIILGAVHDDGNYDGDDCDGDANHDQDYEYIWLTSLNAMQVKFCCI